jgi:hypothetical protein
MRSGGTPNFASMSSESVETELQGGGGISERGKKKKTTENCALKRNCNIPTNLNLVGSNTRTFGETN